jgi:molybdopterin-binding protein
VDEARREENAVKLSARNVLRGRVIEIERGAVSAVVKLDVGGNVISSSITLDALNEMGIEVGSEAMAIIKASSVILGTE